ncbi:unnamed protein product [Prorocentrum cordatum]|uniref:Uncharacterized protein n=1 Tax=Prorocentrum cordatum TaxID=2364126 RepID=A0ABN9QAD9_9DINO|nr:unnamed protein product [Polarella glacialis]
MAVAADPSVEEAAKLRAVRTEAPGPARGEGAEARLALGRGAELLRSGAAELVALLGGDALAERWSGTGGLPTPPRPSSGALGRAPGGLAEVRSRLEQHAEVPAEMQVECSTDAGDADGFQCETVGGDGVKLKKVEFEDAFTAKYGLMNYCFTIRSTMQGEKLLNKFTFGSREKTEKAVQHTLTWLESSTGSDVAGYKGKNKELEDAVNSSLPKAFGHDSSKDEKLRGQFVDGKSRQLTLDWLDTPKLNVVASSKGKHHEREDIVNPFLLKGYGSDFHEGAFHAKHGVVHPCFTMRHSLQEAKLQNKFGERDKDGTEKVAKEAPAAAAELSDELGQQLADGESELVAERPRAAEPERALQRGCQGKAELTARARQAKAASVLQELIEGPGKRDSFSACAPCNRPGAKLSDLTHLLLRVSQMLTHLPLQR